VALSFAELVRQAEEDQILEACRTLRLDRDDVAFVIARHRRSPFLLDLMLVMGGSAKEYVAMVVDARPPEVMPRLRYR
jgi:hypothetical protein